MSDAPSQYNFKYPKPLIETTVPTTKTLIYQHRPQPSPSKHQILMKELGLDQSDLPSDDSSSVSSVTFSDDEGDSLVKLIDAPTKAEHEALQKDRDNLLIQTKELAEKMRQLNSLIGREKQKYHQHVEILKKAQKDMMKDKDHLIENLEDIIFEKEMKIRELLDNLKGNPIKPTIEMAPQTSSIQKFLDSIKSLQTEKSKLNAKIINLEHSLEEKTSKLENIHQYPPAAEDDERKIGLLTANYKEIIDQLKSELSDVKNLLDERDNELVNERENKDLVSDKLDQVEGKFKKSEEERRRTEKKLRREIEDLKNDLEKRTADLYELENKALHVVTKTVECVVEVESSQQKSEIIFAKDRISELENELREKDQLFKKNSDELSRFRKRMNKAQEELLAHRSEMEEQNSLHLEEEANLRFELRQKEAELVKERKNVDKGKKLLKSEQLKVSEFEQEFQELKASSKRAKDESMTEMSALMNRMKRVEEDFRAELVDTEKSSELQKREYESLIERLEKKNQRAEENLTKARNSNRNLSEKLDSSAKELDAMLCESHNKQNAIALLKSQIAELESGMFEQKQKLDDVQQELVFANNQKKTLQAQVEDLSGASDVATLELSTLRSDHSSLQMNISRIESQNKAYEQEVIRSHKKQEEILQHKEALEKDILQLKTDHMKEVSHLKAVHSQTIENARSSANSEIRVYSTKLHKIQSALRHLSSSAHSLAKENQHLKKECLKFPIVIEDTMRLAEKKINDAIADINENSKELIRRYKKEMMLRKKYHNELVELKGNIRVFARVRPTITEDGSGTNAKNIVTYDHDDDGMIYVHSSQRGRSTLFELDKVFQSNSTQSQVYCEVQSLVTSCIDGYHVCIFAYGQTGSGKTYTMEGPANNPGINQRAILDLFKEIEQKSGEWRYDVSVSLLEIYNETLKDLLDSGSASEKLDIKMNADGSLYVPGLKQKSVENLDDVNSLFALGRKNRATACTNMNEHSSRSHAVLMIYVNGVNSTTNTKTFGKLNLIDLAGSERVSKSGASGERLKEAQNINKSLSALGDVIQALGARQSHIPFRNSKLTYLLQDSLSKDSKTLMVVQVAPVEKNVSETMCSLAFAQRVRKVELGQASKKTNDDSTSRKTGTSKSGQQSRRK